MQHAFLTGLIVYPCLELLYRGRTHYSMGIAGGLSAEAFNRLRRLHIPKVMKSFLCSCSVTCIEYICGCIWNRRHQVWDYRREPLNIRGQICLKYSFLWMFLGTAAMSVFDSIDNKRSSSNELLR